MSDSPTTLRPEELLTHRALVRGVVRSLLRDEAAVDDVEQQTWLAAITRPPRDPGSVKSWLVAVARNFARKARTEATRRRRRETEVAAPVASSPADEVRALEERRREVVDHVLALDEPYRTALLLRFFKEMPPRRIAQELDVPVETVKTRLKRGLDQLRQRLDAEHGGDRRAWMTALLPLARPEAAAGLAAVGGVLIGAGIMKTIVFGAAAAALALFTFSAWPEGSDADATVRVRAAEIAERPTIDGARTADVERAVADAAPGAAPSARGVVDGRIIDQDDRPAVPSRALLVGAGDVRLDVPLDATGAYRFEGLAPGDYVLAFTDETERSTYLPPWEDDLDDRVDDALPRRVSLDRSRRAPNDGRPWPSHLYALTEQRGPKNELPRLHVHSGRVYLADVVTLEGPGAKVSSLYHVTRAAQVRGTLVGPEGEPVAQMHVRLQSLQRSGLSYDANTDRFGRFAMVGVRPGPYRTQVFVGPSTAPPYDTITRPLPVDIEVPEGADLELAPLRFRDGSRVVTGEVVDQDGLGFADLAVLCYLKRPVEPGVPPHDWNSTLLRAKTDAQGRYRLEGLPAERVAVVIAPNEGSPGPAGEKLLATFVDGIELDLTTGDDLREAPRRVAERSRPFRFEGQLRLDPALAAREDLDLGDFEVRVVLAPGYASAVADGVRRRSFLGAVDVDDDGRFAWVCETPHAPVDVVIFTDRSGEAKPQRVRTIPVPNGRIERDVRFR